MRVLLALFAIIAISTAVPDFVEDAEPSIHFGEDLLLLDVQADISAMKKKGVTHDDCKDLAITSCKEVEREIATDQSIINKMKTGRHCMSLGVTTEKRAHKHLVKTKTIHLSKKKKVVDARFSKVVFGSRSYSSLRGGKCSFVFSSRSYLSIRALYQRAVRVEISWKGRVTEARKTYLRMKAMRIKQQHKCHCATKKALAKMWRIVTDRKRKAKQNKAYAKCKMMSCVLNGTKLTHSKCKGVLKTLKKKTLYSVTRRTKCSGKKPAPTSDKIAPADPCKKWQAEYKANAEIGKALKAEVKFKGGRVTLTAQGKKTLLAAAKVLNKYPWMTITVEGHSDAPKGARCTHLVIGRAKTTEKFLKSKGVKNTMTRPVGKCGKKRAIEIIGNAAGRGKSPCHAKLVRAPVQRRVRRL